MLATLSALEYNLDGHVALEIREDSDLGETRRRVSRVQTLDGGVAVSDFGHSEGDRTISLRWSPQSADAEAAVAALVRSQSQVVVSVRDGVFRASPEVYQYAPDGSTLRLLTLEKLSA